MEACSTRDLFVLVFREAITILLSLYNSVATTKPNKVGKLETGRGINYTTIALGS